MIDGKFMPNLPYISNIRFLLLFYYVSETHIIENVHPTNPAFLTYVSYFYLIVSMTVHSLHTIQCNLSPIERWSKQTMSYFPSHLSSNECSVVKAACKMGANYGKTGQWLCGSVGRVVASNTRGPRFKSSHWQKFIYIEHLLTVNCILKKRKKSKRWPGTAHLKKLC